MFKNDQGEWSGAKLFLLASYILAVAWLIRDLIMNHALNEYQTALLGILLVVGLINRIGARGFRLKLTKDGAEVETKGDNGNGSV